MAYDSKSDHGTPRFSWKLESKFIGYSIEGGVTYRSVHQEPAPDFDAEPVLPSFGPSKDLGVYTTQSPGFAVVVQYPDAMALASSASGRGLKAARFPEQRRKATRGKYRVLS